MIDFLVHTTEHLLTWRRDRRRKRKSRRLFFSWIIDFFWAAVFVLLINQFLLQAYVIPTGSMIPVFLLQDRIFVDKVVFGPELLPTLVKFPPFRGPRRGEIVVFENPSYQSRGAAFTVLQRMLYMLTLSLVDIDRDESGNPRPQLLVKRVVGMPGDQLRYPHGKMLIRPEGSTSWQTEKEFMQSGGYPSSVMRQISSEELQEIIRVGKEAAMIESFLPVSEISENSLANSAYFDSFAYDLSRQEQRVAISPEDTLQMRRYRLLSRGWYIPPAHFLPLGDNRDNSRDGRYFGPVPVQKLLGRAWIRYWPLNRFGQLQ